MNQSNNVNWMHKRTLGVQKQGPKDEREMLTKENEFSPGMLNGYCRFKSTNHVPNSGELIQPITLSIELEVAHCSVILR